MGKTIKVMPDKKKLEAFLDGFSGPVKVYFNAEKGEFAWNERPKRNNTSKK